VVNSALRPAATHVRKVIGQRLHTLRKQRALSQARLGKESGLSREFIGEVERGERSISLDNLYNVSVALGVRLRDLTNREQRERRVSSTTTFS
jgi:transcriptional regulator with XRE-family HTH domain